MYLSVPHREGYLRSGPSSNIILKDEMIAELEIGPLDKWHITHWH